MIGEEGERNWTILNSEMFLYYPKRSQSKFLTVRFWYAKETYCKNPTCFLKEF